MPEGIVYVLTNEAMPGYIKIGRTGEDLLKRMRDLDSTGIPLPFACFFAKQVADAEFVEKKLHETFADVRVRHKREFFTIDPLRVRSAMDLVTGQEVTPKDDVVQDDDDEKSLEKARKRKANFNFDMVNIPHSSELVFIKDQQVTCTVIDNKKVLFEGEETSLSAAALTAARKLGYNWPSVAGPNYWTYEGETLDERRLRMETDG